jgi:two-component system LytT family response regulator
MIASVIIDDEIQNRNVLKILLEKHCLSIHIAGEADNADDGYQLIQKVNPKLIFLDIKMPGKSGFDLLRMFKEITFEVIFISAFNEFAIHAFEFSALDYILKPIDYVKLIKAVERAQNKITTRPGNEAILHFISSHNEKSNTVSKVTVHQNDRVILISVLDIVYIEGQTDYCQIYLKDNLRYYSSKDLKLFENLLSQDPGFIRVNKSIILNINFIKSYSKGEVCIIELFNGLSFEVSRRKKTEIIKKLRSFTGG